VEVRRMKVQLPLLGLEEQEVEVQGLLLLRLRLKTIRTMPELDKLKMTGIEIRFYPHMEQPVMEPVIVVQIRILVQVQVQVVTIQMITTVDVWG